MRAKQHLMILSLVTLVLWMLILVGRSLLGFTGQSSLSDSVSQQIGLPYVLAPLFLLVVTVLMGWRQAVGLKAAQPGRSWRLIWLPMLFVIGFLGFSFLLGLPPHTVIVFVFINTLLVGLSEELMFRGILFQGLRSRLNLWAAIWLTSLVFGSVHLLNGFTTGDFNSAFIQAISAASAGIWFMALRLRTRSLYPGMLAHALWDFSIFIFSLSASTTAGHLPTPSDPTDSANPFLLLSLDLPLFLYGLWLLRGIGKREREAAFTDLPYTATAK